ncbi:major facilitator superfamily transporter [Tritrichomonas foetus]|uniref:Molybdate-anion transporter n=1 Tax=Tritrichomonas foetus TaxID=1144522 RepID=A0A1J4JCF3_9EUKA|nr:major facilitator superfamily transporter [Tritrichomonas foetus]|eukprot:OHS95093.1 major facilitator superfamily transporter [Tritrichomonas foetus]
MIALSTTFVTVLFIILSGFCVFLKVKKWMKVEKVSSSWLNSFQFRYFLCYYTFMAGLNFQGPYVYKRYLDTGISQDEISVIMSTFNIVSSFWGLVIGYVQEMFGHKRLIILSAMLLSAHATFRFLGGFRNFVISSVLMGVSTASNRVVFEDWLMIMLQNPEAPKLAQATVQENSALIRLFSTLIMTPLSAKLTHHFGSASAFATSSVMFFASAAIMSVYLDDPKSSTESSKSTNANSSSSNDNKKAEKVEKIASDKNENKNENKTDIKKRQKMGYANALKSIYHSVRSSPELSILLLCDFAYNVFTLLYGPRWLAIHQITKKDTLPLSQMSSTNSVALMNGAQILGAVLQLFSTRLSLFYGFFMYVVCISAILIFFSNKNLVYTFYILSAMCDGGLGTIFRMLRSSIYPRDTRGYILGFLRVPTSLTVSLILMLFKGKDVRYFMFLCVVFLSLSTVLSFILYQKEKKEEENAKEE